MTDGEILKLCAIAREYATQPEPKDNECFVGVLDENNELVFVNTKQLAGVIDDGKVN